MRISVIITENISIQLILDHISQLEEVVITPNGKVVGIVDRGCYSGFYLPNIGS